MNILACMLLTLLLLFSPFLSCVLAAPPAIQRQMEIVEATIEGGSIATVDPAAAYDTASGAILLNCYDTLVFFDGEHVDKYLPQLATEWSIVQNNGTKISNNTGLEFYYTYYFKIRTGVQWQNSAFGTVRSEDVEYTFERGMVLEPGDNPQWMFYEPLLNGATMTYIDGHDVDPDGNPTERAWVGWAIDEAVESNSTHVWLNLAFPGAYAPLMQILTQTWSSILCKSWCNSLGRASNWNGDWSVDHTAYYAYHFPAVPPLDDPERARSMFAKELGMLLRRGLIDPDMAYSVFSVGILWEKLKPIVEGVRKHFNEPRLFEDFEYLYNEMKKREQKGDKNG